MGGGEGRRSGRPKLDAGAWQATSAERPQEMQTVSLPPPKNRSDGGRPDLVSRVVTATPSQSGGGGAVLGERLVRTSPGHKHRYIFLQAQLCFFKYSQEPFNSWRERGAGRGGEASKRLARSQKRALFISRVCYRGSLFFCARKLSAVARKVNDHKNDEKANSTTNSSQQAAKGVLRTPLPRGREERGRTRLF